MTRMTDEEMAEADRMLLSKMREFQEALTEYGVGKLDPCDPLRILAQDVDFATEDVAASLRGTERRIEQARIEERRRTRLGERAAQ